MILRRLPVWLGRLDDETHLGVSKGYTTSRNKHPNIKRIVSPGPMWQLEEIVARALSVDLGSGQLIGILYVHEAESGEHTSRSSIPGCSAAVFERPRTLLAFWDCLYLIG